MHMNPTIIEFPVTSSSTSHLPGAVDDYAISTPNMPGVIVTITRLSTGEKVYIGPGPVQVYQSPAPF